MEDPIRIQYSENEVVMIYSERWLNENGWIVHAIKGEFRTDLDVNRVPGGKGFLFKKEVVSKCFKKVTEEYQKQGN